MRHLVNAKIESQLTRAMRYVESIDARAVVPSAGPPCFLDPELFHLNVDHRRRAEHLRRPAHVPRPARAPPATPACWRSPARRSRSAAVAASASTHPIADDEVTAIFERKGEYLAGYQADWSGWLEVDARALGRAARDRPRADAAGVVAAVARGLPDGARGHRRGLPAARCRTRRGDPHRLPGRRRARLRRRAVRVPLRHRPRRSSRRSSPSAPSTGATRCSCRAASGPGGAASSTSTSTTSSSRCRRGGCAAPRPRRCASCTRRPRPSPTSSSTAG